MKDMSVKDLFVYNAHKCLMAYLFHVCLLLCMGLRCLAVKLLPAA